MFNRNTIKLELSGLSLILGLGLNIQISSAAETSSSAYNGIFDVPASQTIITRLGDKPGDDEFYAPSYDQFGNQLDLSDISNKRFTFGVSIYFDYRVTDPTPVQGTRFNLLQGASYDYVASSDDKGRVYYVNQDDVTGYRSTPVGDPALQKYKYSYTGLGKLQLTFKKDGQNISLPDASGKPVANPETLHFINNGKEGSENTSYALIDQLKKLTVTISGETYHLQGEPSVSDYDYVYSGPTHYYDMEHRTTNSTVRVPSGDVKATFTEFSSSASSNSQTNNESITSSNSSESTNSSSTSSNLSPTKRPILKTAVYGLKKLGLYNQPDFSKNTREIFYAKKSRPNRPQFIITGYAQSKNGTPRYLVKDVNIKSKTRGKTGYITTNTHFVGNTYYQKAPKAIRIIGKHGINSYKTPSLSKPVKHYRHGQTLKVKGIMKHHRTTRLILINGHYITANKTLVISK